MEPEVIDDLPPWYRKPLIMAGAVFVTLLIASLTFSQTIEGIVQSKKVAERTLIFTAATIIFTNSTLEQIQQEYLANPQREIKACLFGTKKEPHYYIERVEFPKILRANAIHVQSISCSQDVLIDLHSHPINSCLASDVDIGSLKDIQAQNPQTRMVIMCSKTRFALV